MEENKIVVRSFVRLTGKMFVDGFAKRFDLKENEEFLEEEIGRIYAGQTLKLGNRSDGGGGHGGKVVKTKCETSYSAGETRADNAVFSSLRSNLLITDLEFEFEREKTFALKSFWVSSFFSYLQRTFHRTKQKIKIQPEEKRKKKRLCQSSSNVTVTIVIFTVRIPNLLPFVLR